LSMKRIFWDEKTIDRELFKLSKNNSGDDKMRKIAKRAMREVILNDLTQRQKQFVLLYYYEERNMPEIAEICGVNVSTVSRTLARARKNILERIKYYFIKMEDEE